LNFLDIGSCQLEFGKFGEFCQCLRENRALKKLNLCHNIIADEGSFQLVTAIKTHLA